MDKHYLTALFSPESIAVFAGKWDEPDTQTAQAKVLLTSLRAQRFSGTLTFLDIHTTGTLADLAQTRADLALIALPREDVAAALDIAGRIDVPLPLLVISSGINADAGGRAATGWRAGMACTCWAPTAWASSARALRLNASAGRRHWPRPARWPWCRSRAP
ncbi:MAG: hypothetical protein MZW92_09070 [Comamonadaceae bacterium]|nr:hypothetical protein [Comamonadaceae bacterium]